MPEFIKVAAVTDVPDPGKLLLEVDDRLVVLFHVGGSFFCLDDICTHDGGTLGDGEMDDATISCPRHGATFDVKTGDPLSMPATEPTVAHHVRVDGADVLVQLNEE